jgi:WD40 repeat protein
MKNQKTHAPRHIGLILTFVALMSAPILIGGPARLAYAQAGATWTFIANLNAARAYHTATVLPNGKVLVAGGGSKGSSNTLDTSELYDPNTNTWTITGNLNTAREEHTATLLPNGKVLVTGGFRCSSGTCFILNSAELYDPSTARWTITGNLKTAREEHTATLLPNGKVLIAGNNDGNTAELYDPATETITLTGKLNKGLLLSTATLLSNGKVLIAGGYVSLCGFVCPVDFPSNRAELYDPATGTWSTTGNLNMARYNHSATLLPNGKVLVAGFFNENAGASNSAELYDPATGVWSSTGDLNEALGAQTATSLPNGKVLIAGGSSDFGNSSGAELYDLTTGLWTMTANLHASRSGHTATLLLPGKVLVAGGSGDNTAELYDPGSSSGNAIDDAQFFVRQHYADFLNREPDTAGYDDWLNVLNTCQPNQGGLGSDPACDRVHVSSGFFRSPEFGERGYWVYRFFEGSLGKRPQFAEFMPEMQRLSGSMTDAEQEARRTEFIARFMQLPEFTNIYAELTDASHASQFIAKLEEKARVTLPASATTEPGQPPQYGRQQLIDLMSSGQFTAAQTLRAFIEQKVVWDSYFYRAFVAMQYFGYLRRDPEAAGYDDWVDVLTNGRASAGIQPGDYRHLIFGFIYSTEYRGRFGQP